MSEEKNRKEQVKELIEPWKTSGLGVKNFCIQHQFPEHTFRYWLRKLSTPKKKKKSKTGFLPVQITSKLVKQENSIIEIQYPNGIQIRLNSPINSEVIRSLITID
jgi:predicted acetyltransferase